MSETEEPAGPPVPDRIGRYRVSRALGSGAFATVYLAWDDALDVPVAVKVLGQNWSYEPEIRRRFIQEAQLLRRVDGTRVVRVHDIGETPDGQPFFVMDFASRGTAEDRLIELAADGVELETADLLRFCRQLAAGVQEVHRLEVAHRDLKPSNLLLRRVEVADGAGAPDVGTALIAADERLVVSDLGLAKDLLGATRLTMAVGTPGYMAPEQGDPSASIDERSDIYACTAILQRVVTGAHPAPDGPSLDPAILAQLPGPAAQLLTKGLAHDPEDRFADLGEWLVAVESAVDALAAIESVPADAGELLSGLSRVVSRSSEASSGPRDRAVDVVAPAVARSSLASEPSRSRLPLLLGVGVVVAVLLGALIWAISTMGRDTAESAPSTSTQPPETTTTTTASTTAPVGATPDGADAEPADAAVLVDPIGLALSDDGSLAIVEQSANRVRLLSDGTLSALAGTGTLGFSGDTGPAADAELAGPRSAAYGPDGSLYVVDADNYVIRRVSVDGRIEVVAGSGQAGFGGDQGLATAAALSPTDVAVKADGTLVVADMANGVVREVAPNGTISTLLGPDSQPRAPASIAIGTDGAVFYADLTGQQILRIDPATFGVSVVAGTGTPGFGGDGGPAVQAQLAFPSGIDIGDDGSIYVADRLNHRVRRIDADGIITTVAGSGNEGFDGDGGQASEASLWHPVAVEVAPDGSLYIADGFNNRVRKVDPDGTIETVAGSGPQGEVGDGGPATAAPLGDPFGLALLDGDLLIAGNWSGRVRVVDAQGQIDTLIGSLLSRAGYREQLVTASGISVSSQGLIAVAESALHRVSVFDQAGKVATIGSGSSGFSGDGGPAEAASLSTPTGVAWTADGDLIIADSGNHRVRRVVFDDQTTQIQTIAGTGDIVATPDGLDPTATALLFPFAVAVEADGSILVSEAAGSRVRRIGVDGSVATILGTGVAGSGGDGGPAVAAQVDTPAGIAVAADGTIYVADLGANRVRSVSPDGSTSTVAGVGAPGLGGDGGPASSAALNSPTFLVLDGQLLHIADTGNRRVRTVNLVDETISTSAGAF
ncbi:MAG: protein kinase [Acidimicrobiales bacterium]|nr:protein kinase [Acidimicrobiales bacterium]